MCVLRERKLQNASGDWCQLVDAALSFVTH
jgi:hypothetical protein